MREKLYRFMAGRYGMDQLSKFLCYAALVLLLVNFILKSTVIYVVGIALLVLIYLRTFSKKLEKRRRENAWYLRKTYAVTNGVKNWIDRLKQSKDYVFFRCPSCKAMLRVPRGKGKLRVTCRKCGNSFEKRT